MTNTGLIEVVRSNVMFTSDSKIGPGFRSVRPIAVLFGGVLSPLIGAALAFASCESDRYSCTAGCPEDAGLYDYTSGGLASGTAKADNHTWCVVSCNNKYSTCTASQQQENNGRVFQAPQSVTRKPLGPEDYPVCEGGWNVSRGSVPGEAPARADFLAADKADKRRDFRRAYQLSRKIDEEGMAALSRLSPSTPWLDVLIDKQLDIISWARTLLGNYYMNGTFVDLDESQAAMWYQKAINTKYIDEERRCHISGYPGALTVAQYAIMLIYGRGAEKSEANARSLLKDRAAGAYGDVILTVLNHRAMPATYEQCLKTDLPTLAARLRGR